jgi:hypothetical protein
MPLFIKAASLGGSILILIALAIALLKQLITFVGFITVAIKLLIVIVFVGVFACVGYLIYKGWRDRRKNEV